MTWRSNGQFDDLCSDGSVEKNLRPTFYHKNKCFIGTAMQSVVARMTWLSAVRLCCVCTVLLTCTASGYSGLFLATRQCPPGPWWDVTWTNIPNIRNRDLLKDINRVDANMDDVITLEEMMTLTNWGIDVAPPIGRCEFVGIQSYRYGVYNQVACLLYDVFDVDHDGQLTEAEFRTIFSNNLVSMDINGDSQLSVCELYRGFIDYIREAEETVRLRKIKAREIITKADDEVFNRT
ncbi:uncharacterized protein LOC121368529 [Gigantopelta aegis]|uniref:uncharacterized protein LOC121368529 n=1 Tax=Gigantopelta aegis TaxID=1735272 RepID=UPI001B88868E|nr:uncharacterized protein LOC121368529 [Gigantopelta aegis]